MHNGHNLESHGQPIDQASWRVQLGLRHAGAVFPRCHSVVTRTEGGGATLQMAKWMSCLALILSPLVTLS